MEQFLKAVADSLASAGFVVKYNFGDDFMVVAGCYYRAYRYRSGWQFQNRYYSRRNQNVMQAIQDIIAAMPEKLAALDVVARRKQYFAAAERIKAEQKERPRCKVSYSDDGVTLTFTHEESDAILMAMDILEDNGLLEVRR